MSEISAREARRIRDMIRYTSMSSTEIAKQIGRTRNSIIGWAYRNGGGIEAIRRAVTMEHIGWMSTLNLSDIDERAIPKPAEIRLDNLRAIKNTPDWQCRTLGCKNNRAAPYQHCQSCKARMMRPNKRAHVFVGETRGSSLG